MTTSAKNTTMKVVGVSDERTASDGRKYFVLEARTGFGLRSAKRTMWQQFKRDKDGNPTPETFWERGSHAEALELLANGGTIEARKVTHTVEEYSIGEREVNQFSTIVFADENEATVFKAQGHPIVDTESGEIIDTVKVSLKPKAEVGADAVIDFSK